MFTGDVHCGESRIAALGVWPVVSQVREIHFDLKVSSIHCERTVGLSGRSAASSRIISSGTGLNRLKTLLSGETRVGSLTRVSAGSATARLHGQMAENAATHPRKSPRAAPELRSRCSADDNM